MKQSDQLIKATLQEIQVYIRTNRKTLTTIEVPPTLQPDQTYDVLVYPNKKKPIYLHVMKSEEPKTLMSFLNTNKLFKTMEKKWKTQ